MAWNPASIITLVRYKKGNIPLVPSKRVRKLKKQAKEQQQWIKDWLAELPKAENVVSPAKTPVVGPKAPGTLVPDHQGTLMKPLPPGLYY